MIKWAAEEAERLGIVFSLTIDYGYGSGSALSPENSMQQLSVTKTHVTDRRKVSIQLPKPKIPAVWRKPNPIVIRRCLRFRHRV